MAAACILNRRLSSFREAEDCPSGGTPSSISRPVSSSTREEEASAPMTPQLQARAVFPAGRASSLGTRRRAVVSTC